MSKPIKISAKKQDLLWALRAIIVDYENTIEVIKTGALPAISIGQFRRLTHAREILSKAEAK